MLKKFKRIIAGGVSVLMVGFATLMPSSSIPFSELFSGNNITAFATTYDFAVNNVYYGITSSSAKTISVNGGTGTSITIPKTVTYNGVTYTVSSIIANAFLNNNSLTSINMSYATNILSIPNYAFKSCTALSSVTLPSALTSINKCAFYYCYSLQSIKIPTSVNYIGNMAFYNCTNLANIDMVPTNRTIVQDAFFGTSYYTNNYTTGSYLMRSSGSAGCCTGKQVVISLFLDEKSAQFTTNGTYTYPYTWTDQNGVVHQKNNSFPRYIDSIGKTYYSINTTVSGYTYSNCWNTTADANGCVYSINNGNYQKVRSTDISNQITKLDSALTNIENQAAEYGKSVEFVSVEDDPALGMYFTVDRWNPTQTIADDNFLQDMTATNGYADYLNTMGSIQGDRKSLFECLSGGVSPNSHSVPDGTTREACNAFQQIQNATSGNNYYSNIFGLSSVSYNGLSFFNDTNLTSALKQKYNADGVVYIIFTNNNYRSWAHQLTNESASTEPEFTALCSGNTSFDNYGTSNTYMHEILHLYGAEDYYGVTNSGNTVTVSNTEGSVNNSGKVFAYTYYNNEIMIDSDISTKIGAITAYCIGWSNNIPRYDYKIMFDGIQNGMTYDFGDINMDGNVNITDMGLLTSYCAGTQQLTYSQLIMAGYGQSKIYNWSDNVTKDNNYVNCNGYQIEIGDVNFDGLINSTDANTLGSIINATLPNLYLQKLVADIDNNGVINISDLIALNQKITG